MFPFAAELEHEAKRRLGELELGARRSKLEQALRQFEEESPGHEQEANSRGTSMASFPSSIKREGDALSINELLKRAVERLTLDSKTKLCRLSTAVSQSVTDIPNGISQAYESGGGGQPDPFKRYRDRLIAFNSNSRREDKHYEEALILYLSLDVPSLRWPIDPKEEDKELRAARRDIGQWAIDKLSSLHIDISVDMVVQAMITQSIKSRINARAKSLETANRSANTAVPSLYVKANASRPEWFRMMPTASPQDLHDSYKYASIAYLMASSAAAGWQGIKKALSHILVPHDEEAGKKAAPPVALRGTVWSPLSYEKRFVDLQQLVPGLVEKAINKVQGQYKRHRGGQVEEADKVVRAAMDELASMNKAELVDAAMFILPMTYLQIVGQKILYHASFELPFLSSISPECCGTVLSLFARPFTAAVRRATEAICANPEMIDPVPFASKGVEDLGNKRWRGIGTMGGAPPAAGGAMDKEEGVRAKNGLKAVLNMIRGICKDVSLFEQGLSDILDHDPGLLSDPPSANTTEPRLVTPERDSTKSPPRASPQDSGSARLKEQARQQKGPETFMSAYGLRAAAIKSIVRADIKSSMIEERDRFFQLLFGSMNSTIKGMLAAGSSNTLEEVRGEQIWPEVDAYLFSPTSTSPTSPRRVGPKTEGFLDDKPQYIDGSSHQILVFLYKHSHDLGKQPDIIQAPFAVAILEGLALLMDSLASQAENLSSPSSPSSSSTPKDKAKESVCAPKRLLLLHSASLCIRRQLLAFTNALDMPLQDNFYDSMLKGYGNTLMQADELASSLSQRVVAAHARASNLIVWTSVDNADWASFKRPGKRPQGASAAPRMWRLALLRLLHSLAQTCSLSFSTWALGQIIQEGLGSAVMRYAHLSPSSQLLSRYASDVLHITSTCFMFSQDIPVPILEALTLAAEENVDSVETSAASRAQARKGSSTHQGSSTDLLVTARSKSQATLDALKSSGLSFNEAAFGAKRSKSKSNLARVKRAGSVARLTRDESPQKSLPSASIFGSASDVPSIILPGPIMAAISSTCFAMCTRVSLLVCSPDELASKIRLTGPQAGPQAGDRVSVVKGPWQGLGPVAEGVEDGDDVRAMVGANEGPMLEDQPSSYARRLSNGAVSNSSGISDVAASAARDMGFASSNGPQEMRKDGEDVQSSLPTSTSAQGRSSRQGSSRQLNISQSARPSRTERQPVSNLSRHLRIEEETEVAEDESKAVAPKTVVPKVTPPPPNVATAPGQEGRVAEIEKCWGWLPKEVRKALVAASKRMITARQLANTLGFDPLEHIDLLSTGPYCPAPSTQRAGVSFPSSALTPAPEPEPAPARGRALMKSKTAIGGGAAAAATGRVLPPQLQPPPSSSHAPPLSESMADPWSEALAGLWARSQFHTAILALAKRHELHIKVQGLPYSLEEMEARVVVGRLAEQFGVVPA